MGPIRLYDRSERKVTRNLVERIKIGRSDVCCQELDRTVMGRNKDMMIYVSMSYMYIMV